MQMRQRDAFALTRFCNKHRVFVDGKSARSPSTAQPNRSSPCFASGS